MKVRVVYHSKSGNTRKVAEAMAKVAGVEAEDIASIPELTETVDLLFIGDGVYFGNMSKAMRLFIEKLNSGMVKHAAVFGTYGGENKAVLKMRELLGARGIEVTGEGFGCKGKSWFIINRSRPNEKDLGDAGRFVEGVVQALSK